MKSMILILQQFIKDNSSYLETTEQMIFKVTPRKKKLNQHRKKKAGEPKLVLQIKHTNILII